MPRTFEGEPTSRADRFAIVVSRYNESITSRLLDGAVATLKQHGIGDDRIDVAWVPGSFEIPLAADRMAATGAYDAVLCLGAVIRGETTHDQHINRAVSSGIGQIALNRGLPILFGVLTCESLEQAFQRAGGAQGNKGSECAESALRMISLLDQLDRANP